MKTSIDFDTAAVFGGRFQAALAAEQVKSGFPLDQWFYSGRQAPAASVEWWWANGPALAQRYIDWYEANQDIKVWITPDGKPAVELDLQVQFGEVEVRMVIDQVLCVGSALVVNDLKTGAKAPESPVQLGIYASGVELAYGIRPKYGAYFMHRNEEDPFKPVPLSGYEHSIPFLTQQFERFARARSAGAFVANPGKRCDRCPVAHACAAAGGKDARKHDPSHPGYRKGSTR